MPTAEPARSAPQPAAAAGELEFASEGATLRGRLTLPAGGHPVPTIVMAHGFSATARGMTADRYAAAFADAGFGTFLYDHRGFGQSGGEPRGEVNTWIQARGYRDALDLVAPLPGVREDRLALWGDSFSGGVALGVAAVDARVTALLLIAPACGRDVQPDDPDGELYARMRERMLVGDPRASAPEWRGPMPVVSVHPESESAALPVASAFDWFTEYGLRPGTGWENRVVLTAPRRDTWHPMIWAAHVRAATCTILGAGDDMPGASAFAARRTFELLAGRKELHEVDGGHFGMLRYPSAVFDRAAAIQVAFLRGLEGSAATM
ncbi:alpha/beta hydrolase [Rathayibacter soli]|uniref:alpha/beta hydrolase n=1 Tax=Rathayibacter soli TaxID=3144168 RepID=UPI0027E46C6C|nr:alpha/beta fold hydrolase [Glaciibacter superstes]